jgi:hypothetical protein
VVGGNRAGLDAARLDAVTIIDSKRSRVGVQLYADQGLSTRLKDCLGHSLESLASDNESSSEDAPVRDRNPNRKKSGKWDSKRAAAKKRAADRAARIKALVDQGDEVFLEFSWEDRKKIALSSFTRALGEEKSTAEAHELAAFAARVSVRTSNRWIADWKANEGAWSESTWGRHSKWLSIFTDDEVRLKSLKWWMKQKPKKGERNARVADFQLFLNGDKNALGLLDRIFGEDCRKTCYASCLRFTHALGFNKVSLKKGSFNDAHENESNVADRNARFLPQYFKYYQLSPHTTRVNGEIVENDSLEDLSLRSNFYPITGPTGTLNIDMGGLVDLESPDTVWLIGSHDESCAAAGEFETAAWMPKDAKQVCMDKSKGPSKHDSKIVVKYGNGSVCLRPDLPRPAALTFKEFNQFFADRAAGLDPPLPRTADVMMDPGTNKDGWWSSQQFWQQMELAVLIHEAVFPPQFKLLVVIDWSQGHAAAALSALLAERMNVGPGGKQPHLKHTFWPRTLNGFDVQRPRLVHCTPNCAECQSAFDAHGHNPDFQSVGRKGLKQVLLERGLLSARMVQQQMIQELQKCDDFKIKWEGDRAFITEFMDSRGHKALFGVKYHAELAWIERVWMWEKQLIRPRLDGTLPTLTKLLSKAHSSYKLHDCWKAARHCRDTMHAYQILAEQNLDLDAVEGVQKQYKGHRCAIDGADGVLKMKANVTQSDHQLKITKRTIVRRDHDQLREKQLTKHTEDIMRSYFRRLERFKKKSEWFARTYLGT